MLYSDEDKNHNSESLNKTKSLREKYDSLTMFRERFVNKAREASRVSIQSFYTYGDSGHNAMGVLDQPYQSFVARGLQNLVNTTMSALLSLEDGIPFFKFTPDQEYLSKFIQETGKGKSFIDIALSTLERNVAEDMHKDGLGAVVSEALYHLFIAGNTLLYIPDNPDKKLICYPLTKFVINRDGDGNPTHILTRECVDVEYVKEHLREDFDIKLEDEKENNVLITSCELKNGRWEFQQELNNVLLPETKGTYNKSECPFIPLTFMRLNNCDYGMSLIEMYYGDILALEGLWKDVVDASRFSARMYILLRSGAIARPEDLNESNNGGFIEVNDPNEITVLQTNKGNDLSITMQAIQRLEANLSSVFLMQKDNGNRERVTAEEIRASIQQLEKSLGSFYSMMSVEMQLPVVTAFLSRFKSAHPGLMKSLSSKMLRPTIVTGLQALGRVREVDKLTAFSQIMQQTFGPNVMAIVNTTDFANRLASSLSIADYQHLVKNEEQLAQEAQQQQKMQLVQNAAPHIVKGVMNIAEAQNEQTTNNPQE